MLKNDYTIEIENILQHLREENTNVSIEFDKLYNNSSVIVLFGAGNMGKKVCKLLAKIFPGKLFFADNNPQIIGTEIYGIKVLAPHNAAKLFGEDAIFVVCAFSRESHSDYRDIKTSLEDFGVKHIVPFHLLAWKFSAELLPHFAQGTPNDIFPHTEQILSASHLFHDQRSHEVFLELLSVSIAPKYELFSPTETTPQYFPVELIQKLPELIIVADCGAFTGDTLKDFILQIGVERLEAWYAIEPDRKSFDKLVSYVKELPVDIQPRIKCYHAAVGDRHAMVSVDFDGESTAIVSSSPSANIPCLTLDSIFSNNPCSLIKMDIEGYEAKALLGAKDIIRRDKPILALSAYHKPTDFFALPILIQNLWGNYYDTMLLKRYGSYFFESVLYCL